MASSRWVARERAPYLGVAVRRGPPRLDSEFLVSGRSPRTHRDAGSIKALRHPHDDPVHSECLQAQTDIDNHPQNIYLCLVLRAPVAICFSFGSTWKLGTARYEEEE